MDCGDVELVLSCWTVRLADCSVCPFIVVIAALRTLKVGWSCAFDAPHIAHLADVGESPVVNSAIMGGFIGAWVGAVIGVSVIAIVVIVHCGCVSEVVVLRVRR